MKILFSILFSLALSLSYGQTGRGRGNGQGTGNGHSNAQGRGNGHGHGNPQGRGNGHVRHGYNKKVVVVHRSPYRPARMGVYHPIWGPQFAYNRRWVYFPHRNLYWDNWRGHYVFWNGTIWISQVALPAGIIVTDLHKEDKKELGEDQDDVDDVYKGNEQHKVN